MILLDNEPVDQKFSMGHWYRSAACRDADPDGFSSYDGEIGVPARANTVANRLCARCPVFAACHLEATQNRLVGLWGGSWRDVAYKGRYRITVLVENWRRAADPTTGKH